MQNYLKGSLDLHSGSKIYIKTIDLEKECYTYDLDVPRSNPTGEDSMWISKTSMWGSGILSMGVEARVSPYRSLNSKSIGSPKP